MRSGRNVSSTAVLFFLFLFILPPAWGAQNERTSPRILWAFGAMRASSSHPRVEPVTSKMVLSSGDKVQMMIQIRKKCFVYLIHKDSQGNFTMLFPYSLKQFDTDYRIARNYFVPEGGAWFQLDKRTGKETFYLIASDQRLRDVEFTYQTYASCKEPGKKQDLAGQMLSELDGVKKRYLASSPGVEEPAGKRYAVRGFERALGADPTDITRLAKEISFDNIYSKTFVIDHR